MQNTRCARGHDVTLSGDGRCSSEKIVTKEKNTTGIHFWTPDIYEVFGQLLLRSSAEFGLVTARINPRVHKLFRIINFVLCTFVFPTLYNQNRAVQNEVGEGVL
jgi:hypothetical protein